MSSRRSMAAAAALTLSLLAGCGSQVATPISSPGEAATASPGASGTASGPSAAAAPPSCPPTTSAPSGSRPWWQDRVFYEVFVRSFADSDGDGIGDLRGLTERLDELNDGDPSTTDDLGVTALWLMPIDASPSYHGYDVTDYRKVNPDYGTNDDFKALVKAARQRGIEVIVDLVINHTSIEHPWFQDAETPGSKHDDWYVWSDTEPAVSGPGGTPVWHEDGGRWYYGYFWEGMPDLNLRNPDVTAALDSIARFWVDDMGAAGFRIDAARHLIEDGATLANTPETFDWLEGFRERLHADAPDALTLGEVWDATSMASRYVRDGALDLTFDFDLAAQLVQAPRSGDAGSLRLTQDQVSDSYPAGGYAAFLTNHDQDRSFDELGQDVARAKQAAVLLLTNPGVPVIYYGEEIGLRGRKPDERIRTPLPWNGTAPGYGFTTGKPWEAMADDVATNNVAAETGDPASLLSRYRDLIRLRSAHPALGTAGSLIDLEATSGGAASSGGGATPGSGATPARSIYAVLRHDPTTGERIVVVSNLSDDPVPDVRLSLASGPLCGSPQVSGLLGSAPPAGPVVTAAGGMDGWPVGDLAPHEDRILALMP